MRLIEQGDLDVWPLLDKPQPSSIDVHLGNDFKWFNEKLTGDIDLGTELPDDLMIGTWVDADGFYRLMPDGFCLATTIERVKIPTYLRGILHGKSSLGRLSVEVHRTAGLLDPGFEGEITLEISSRCPRPIRLRPGIPIGQISFELLTEPAERPYGSDGLYSKYQGQTGATASRFERIRGKSHDIDSS